MKWGEDTLTLETGKIARQADGSVIATLGETSVMANVTFAKEEKPGHHRKRPDVSVTINRKLTKTLHCIGMNRMFPCVQ